MADSTRSQTYKRRNRGGQDAKLARNLAAIQALNSSSSRFATGSHRSSKRSSSSSSSSSSSPGRLKFLLSILLVTSLLLVILQTFRHLRFNSNKLSSSSSFETRLKRAQAILQSKQNDQVKESNGWKDRIVNAASVVMDSSAQDPIASAAAITSQREKKVENSENSLDWKEYLAGMKKHFDEELNKVEKTPEEIAKDTGKKVEAKFASDVQGKRGRGLAIDPSETIRNHESSIPFDQQDLPAVDGKSDQEAKSDRKVALEDIDQETLKAMFDALYGRG